MKNLAIAVVIVVAVYFSAYAWERGTHRFVRHIGREEYALSSESGTPTEWLIFQPAWILERKTRSLVWRVTNRKPLFGHVNFDGTEE